VSSIINVNDFSWRHRVAAWEGALQMIGERPLLGFGWNRPEADYESYYRAATVSDGAAIQLNDYLILGATLGIPALVCFAMYVWTGLVGKAECGTAVAALRRAGKRTADISEEEWMKTVCRAGAIVLAVGFWFDAGLFKLPTASTFWVLLELGREA
jgi:O-antigen ligase